MVRGIADDEPQMSAGLRETASIGGFEASSEESPGMPLRMLRIADWRVLVPSNMEDCADQERIFGASEAGEGWEGRQ